MAANNVYIQVDYNSKDAQAAVNALNKALAETGTTSEKSDAQASKALNGVQISVTQTTKAFGELTQAVAGLGLERMAQDIIQTGSELNRAQQAMAAFVGSAEEAAEITEKIRAIAQQSPFRFKDLEESARRLAGFGVTAQQIPVWLKIISDQAAAMGGSVENVNNIVTLFGRVMNKEFIGAMDLMRMLPGQGLKVGQALVKAFGKDGGGVQATIQDVQKAIKAGALDPMNVLLVMLGAMQGQTRGAGAAMQDFQKVLKNIGDAFDRVYQDLTSEKGFGPALRALGKEIEVALAPIAALIKMLMSLPEPVKVILVNIVALTAAVLAFGTAWGLFSTIASPAITVLSGLATAFKSLGAAILLDNPEILLAIGLIGGALYGLSKLFPVQAQKVLDWMSDVWNKIKGKAKEIAQATGILPKDMPIGDLDKPGKITKETKDNLEALQQQVQQWADSAGKTMLNALSSPADAVVMKYKDLFDKLEKEISDKFIAPGHADELRDQLKAAQQMEMESKLFEQKKTDIAELYKIESEKAKAAYEAQILYIEAQDAQDLKTKVANIDKVTQLRIESAHTQERLENEQLQDTYSAQVAYLEQYKELFKKAGIDIGVTEQRLREEMENKQKYNTAKAVDDEMKYRLEGWKKANDAIIEDQKRVYEAFQSMFDDIFDAFTQKSKSIGQALGDVFKKLALGEAKNIFSSQAATFATELAGYGQPEPGIRRSGGILSTLFSRGMPPRPMMAPPEGYNPAKSESAISFGDIVPGGGSGTANRIAGAADVMNVSAVVFSDAVNRFSDATVQTKGSADRIDESADTMSGASSDVSDALSRASRVTGVPLDLLRAQARQESGFQPGLTSPKGAQGLMQLMPITQRQWGITNPFDPYQSAMGGAEQMQWLMKRYGGDLPSVLAAYNMGAAKYDRYMAKNIPLPPETVGYVKSITALLKSPAVQAQAAAMTGTPVYDVGATFSTTATAPMPTPEAAAGGYTPLPSDMQAGGYTPVTWGITSGGDVTTAATPSEVARAKQAGALAQVLGIAGAATGVTKQAGGGAQQASLAQGINLQKLSNLFGIGQATGGGTTLGSVLGSKGISNLVGMAGMMGIAGGLNKRNAPLTTLGGAAAGFGMVGMGGMALPGGYVLGPLGGVAVGAGAGLYAAGMQRGGFGGMAMDIGGGALAGAALGFTFGGGPLGAAIGAGIGAAVGAISGAVRLFVQTEQERIRSQIKQVYGIDISNRQILTQIQQIVDQKYGGSVSIGVRSQEVQDLVRLYALSTGQAANMPRPMYAATVAQSTSGLQLQPVYQGGVQVANPYSGPTTYQYQTAVATAMGLKAGTNLGVPGASGIITNQWQQLALQTIQGNPSSIAMAGAAAATAGDSRLTTTAAMQEPLTSLG